MDQIQTFATRGDQLLFHFAFIPDTEARLQASRLSQTMVAQAYKNTSYVLVNGMEDLDGRVQSAANNYSLVGKSSLPHATLMHFWATPEQAAKTAEAFAIACDEAVLPTVVVARGLSMFPELPRFLAQPGQMDAVSWIDIDRDEALLDVQAKFHAAVGHAEATPVTKLGAQGWNPHWTLLAAPVETKEAGPRIVSLDEYGMVPPGPKKGSLALGLSGPNGQFRCVLCYAAQLKEIAPKLPSIVRQIRQVVPAKAL